MNNEELYHHGIIGQRWGVRRYQNEDGSLTEAGRKRYGVSNSKSAGSYKRALKKLDNDSVEEQANYKKHGVKSDIYAKKASKLKAKGNNEKAENYIKKARDEANLRDEHIQNLKNIDSQMWKTLGAAAENGFSVKMIDRQVISKGAERAQLALGLFGSTPYTLAKQSQYAKHGYNYVNNAFKFKIKKSKNGQATITPSARMIMGR